MTIIKDDLPPPPYSAIPSIDSTDTSAPSSHFGPVPLVNESSLPGASASGLQQQLHHVQYGPTPIPHRGTLLPYYDPQSPYAMRQAISRARWRFLAAFLWAIGIYVALGVVTGGIVIDIRRSR